jgi:hypothetical protein
MFRRHIVFIPLVAWWACAAACPAGAEPRVIPMDAGARIRPDTQPPAGDPGPIRLAGPRNGSASGQAVLFAGAPVAQVQASLPELKHATGSGKIPAERIQIAFPSRHVDLTGRKEWDLGQTDYFDVLAEKLVPGEPVQPVWITVSIPADAPPGDYRGELRVTGNGLSAKAPVHLKVCGFLAPGPGQYQELIAMRQSPESVAERYDVPMYSDAHFKLLDRSLELMGQLGNNVLYVPVIAGGNFGYRHGLIHFRQSGGKLEPDFTAFDRYWSLVLKHCGPPRLVILHLWTSAHAAQAAFTLTGAAGAGRTLENFQTALLPAHQDGWKAMAAGVVQRTQKAGLAEGAVRLGLTTDNHPTKETVDYFQAALPQMTWAAWTHGYGYRGAQGANGHPVSFWERPDLTGDVGSYGRSGAWRSHWQLLTPRTELGDASPPLLYRYIADLCIGRHKMGWFRGLGEVGHDYWSLPPPKEQRESTDRKVKQRAQPYRRYGEDCRLVRGLARAVTAAGPAGAIPTVRFQQMREGVHEAEARIVIEQAVADKKLPADLQGRCDAYLKERFPAIIQLKDFGDWVARAERLFELAGEVQRVAGK